MSTIFFQISPLSRRLGGKIFLLFSTTFLASSPFTPEEPDFVIDSKTFPPHHRTRSAARSESSRGPFVPLQGKSFTEGNFDADEEEGKEKEETLSEAVPRVGPCRVFWVSASAGTFLLTSGCYQVFSLRRRPGLTGWLSKIPNPYENCCSRSSIMLETRQEALARRTFSQGRKNDEPDQKESRKSQVYRTCHSR